MDLGRAVSTGEPIIGSEPVARMLSREASSVYTSEFPTRDFCIYPLVDPGHLKLGYQAAQICSLSQPLRRLPIFHFQNSTILPACLNLSWWNPSAVPD